MSELIVDKSDGITTLTLGDGMNLEKEINRNFSSASAEEIAERRAQVQSRGRDQSR